MIDSVPLIQNANDVQQINASIIAMKKASRELDEKIGKLNSLNSELDKKIALLDSGLNKEIEDRKEAIKSLDVASVGGSGKYISAISETDGKISATASDITSTVSSGNSQPITSGGVYNLDTFPLTRFVVNVGFDSTIYSAGTNITAQQLVNFLKQKKYIKTKELATGFDGVHLILNFVNSIASQWKFDNVGLRCAWIEFEGAFISLDSTSSEERWIMKIHTVETKAEYVAFKLASSNPATYKVGLTAI